MNWALRAVCAVVVVCGARMAGGGEIGEGERAWLDVVLYAGEEKTIRLSDLEAAAEAEAELQKAAEVE